MNLEHVVVYHQTQLCGSDDGLTRNLDMNRFESFRSKENGLLMNIDELEKK